MEEILVSMADNWVYWAVSIFAIIAAYIDGKELRVPNKITFPMIITGWIYSAIFNSRGLGRLKVLFVVRAGLI